MRIVSLLPSATEILCAIGLQDHLVGVTHECDTPTAVRSLPKVTRTLIPTDATSGEIDGLVRERLQDRRALYTLDLPLLETLRPELIVTQALCDVCAVSESEVADAACRLPGKPQVLNLEPTTLQGVLDSLHAVGAATGRDDAAQAVVDGLRVRIDRVSRRSQTVRDRPRVVLLEWIDPPFSCGHWTPELVARAGGQEGLGRSGERSRTVDWAEIQNFDPEILVIACCGLSIERSLQDISRLREYPGFESLTCTRSERVYVVDGNAYFSRPGPRLVDSLELLAALLHPQLHTPPAGVMVPCFLDGRPAWQV